MAALGAKSAVSDCILLNVYIITLQVISSAAGPLASSSPARTDACQLHQQLLEEKRISAKLRGELSHVELSCDSE